MKISLNNNWTVKRVGQEEEYNANVPCSVYSVLIDNKVISHPYIAENQYEAVKLSGFDYQFEKSFFINDEIKKSDKLFLQFDGIDTLADVYLNDKLLGKAENMHRTYRFDVTAKLIIGENKLKIYIHSPNEYVTRRQNERPLFAVGDGTTMPGYSYIRKAHYMFGWDWGPILPDLGIWRDVSLIIVKNAQINEVNFKQQHFKNRVELQVSTLIDEVKPTDLSVKCIITDNCGFTAEKAIKANKNAVFEFEICDPKIWWPRGYGKQPLYNVKVLLTSNGETVDEKNFRIGLRTVGISTQKDEYGNEFCFVVNGIKIFAMGANYIPEEQILPYRSKEATDDLLEICANANYNCIRVWGGGFYQDDWFYDKCDELGLLVWQDFMFACAVYVCDNDFITNITAELNDNIKRLRHHACIGMWCGNNENETMWADWGINQDDELKADYLFQFEKLIPEIVQKLDSQRFYLSSSPTSTGGFEKPNDYNHGDTHNWDIWHNYKPLDEFRNYKFRFCSEYGFEALPDYKTIRYFAKETECNLTHPVIEAHHKCDKGQTKLTHYLTELMPYPHSFKKLIYATQLMQADAIRYSVEHMRRFRGICMGSTYWQVNDSNPTISWSSVDSFHRLKALHYYAKRFYSPLLVCINESNLKNIIVSIANELLVDKNLKLVVNLRDNLGQIVLSKEENINISALSSFDAVNLDVSKFAKDNNSSRKYLIECKLFDNKECVFETCALLSPVKSFEFIKPNVEFEVSINGDKVEILFSCENFAKGVFVWFDDFDVKFSDNWFDLFKGEKKYLSFENKNLTKEQIERNLKIMSCYDIATEE